MLLTTGCVEAWASGLNILRAIALPSPAVHHMPPATARDEHYCHDGGDTSVTAFALSAQPVSVPSVARSWSALCWIGSCIIARSPWISVYLVLLFCATSHNPPHGPHHAESEEARHGEHDDEMQDLIHRDPGEVSVADQRQVLPTGHVSSYTVMSTMSIGAGTSVHTNGNSRLSTDTSVRPGVARRCR